MTCKNKKFMIWISLLCACLMVSLQRQQLAVLSTFMANKLSILETQVSTLSSATMYGLMLMQIPSGILIDKYGVRKVNMFFMFITLISSVLISLTGNYNIALVARFFIGASISTISISVFKVQAEWFEVKYFTIMSAVMMFISNLGAFLTTIPLSKLNDIVGGENVLWVITIYTLICFILVIVFVSDKKEEGIHYQQFSLFSSLQSVLTNIYSWPPIFLIFFLLSTTSSLLGFWAIPFLKDTYTISTIEAAGYFSYFTIGFVLGSFVSYIVDKIKYLNYKKNLIIFTGIYASSWFYIMIICKGKPSIQIIPLLFIIMGIAITNHLFAFTAVKSVNKVQNIGVATSVVTSMDFAGSILLNTLIVSMINNGNSINQAFILMFVFSSISFISSFFVKYTDQ